MKTVNWYSFNRTDLPVTFSCMHWWTYNTSSDSISLRKFGPNNTASWLRALLLFGPWQIRIYARTRLTLAAGFRALPQISQPDFFIVLRLIYDDSFQIRSSSPQINQPVYQRALHTARCKKMNHCKCYSRGCCCVVAGVLSEVSNKIGNEGVKNSTPCAWLVRMTATHCFETSSIATKWHGANSTAVTAMTSQNLLM